MKLVGSGELESISTRADGTIKMIIGTNEIGSDDAGKLFMFRKKFLKWFITTENISTLEQELISANEITEAKQKTPSQKLRAVLFVWHKQQGLKESFEDYYASEMAKICNHYKSKLQPA